MTTWAINRAAIACACFGLCLLTIGAAIIGGM